MSIIYKNKSLGSNKHQVSAYILSIYGCFFAGGMFFGYAQDIKEDTPAVCQYHFGSHDQVSLHWQKLLAIKPSNLEKQKVIIIHNLAVKHFYKFEIFAILCVIIFKICYKEVFLRPYSGEANNRCGSLLRENRLFNYFIFFN